MQQTPHEPLTTRRLFEASTPIGRSNRGSRPGAGLNRHPAAQRSYRLRSYVICALCDRRLYGRTLRRRETYNYYVYQPKPAHHAHRDWYRTHPKSLWVREDKLLTAVNTFFARRIFGPDRAAFLAEPEPTTGQLEDRSAAQRATLEAKIREVQRQQTNVITELQTYQTTGDPDIDRQWTAQLRASFAKLGAQRKTTEAELAALATAPIAGHRDERLLDRLPVLDVDLAGLPEDLQRQLFDAFHLQIRYHQPTNRATLRVTINGDTSRQLTELSPVPSDDGDPRDAGQRTPTPPRATAAGTEAFSDAMSAPNGIRTRATALKDRPPIVIVWSQACLSAGRTPCRVLRMLSWAGLRPTNRSMDPAAVSLTTRPI
jgi:site-specific DNA recombinase